MRIRKYEVKIVFRFKSFWIGIYPNELKGKLCIAFLPFCILRITNKESNYQCENEMLKDALSGMLKHSYQHGARIVVGKTGKRYEVEHLLQVINNSTVGN